MKDLQTIKDEVVIQYDKNDWKDVLRDYEYGMGVSKLIDFESLMDEVAKRYATEALKEASERATTEETISTKGFFGFTTFGIIVDKQSILNIIQEL